MIIHIVITPDDNVIDSTFVLLNSLRKTNPDSKFKIHLIHCDLNNKNLARILAFAKKLKLNIRDYFIAPERLNDIRGKMNTDKVTRITASTLIRCVITETLPKSLKRIIYFDTDIVVIQSITPLFNYNLNGKTIGAVIGVLHDHLQTDFGIAGDDYFNAGVLLIDFTKWRKNKISEKATRILTEQYKHCIYLDQCALNIALKGQFTKLPPQWNVFIVKADTLSNLQEVSVIHYVGPTKPWDWPEHHPFGVFYYLYSKGTPAEIEYDVKKNAPPKKFFRLNSIKRIPKRFKQSLLKRIAKITTPTIQDR